MVEAAASVLPLSLWVVTEPVSKGSHSEQHTIQRKSSFAHEAFSYLEWRTRFKNHSYNRVSKKFFHCVCQNEINYSLFTNMQLF